MGVCGEEGQGGEQLWRTVWLGEMGLRVKGPLQDFGLYLEARDGCL